MHYVGSPVIFGLSIITLANGHGLKLQFLDWKNNGGLTVPSLSTIRVCESPERCLQRLLAANDGMLPQVLGNLVATIQVVVLTESCEKSV